MSYFGGLVLFLDGLSIGAGEVDGPIAFLLAVTIGLAGVMIIGARP